MLIRINAGFLILASAGGLATDIAGSFFGRGAEAVLLGDAPGTGIGFIEAHGLAFIIGLTMWRVAYSRNCRPPATRYQTRPNSGATAPNSIRAVAMAGWKSGSRSGHDYHG